MGKLYLHIGLHKTGTSSIQHWLARNRAELWELGYVYPGTQVHHNDLYLALCAAPEKEHANLRRGVAGAAAARAQARRVLDGYAEAARQAGDRDLVISGEEICRLGAEEVHTLKAFFDPFVTGFQILCFVRSPVGFATSYAQEAIKGGGSTLAIESRFPFLPQYRERIEKFMTIFSPGCVRVADFDDPGIRAQGAVAAFAALLGARAAALEPADIRLNTALPMHAVELLSRINTLYPEFIPDGQGGEIANPQRARIPVQGLSRLGGGPFRMSRDWQAAVLAASAQDTAWLKAEFGIDYGPGEPEADAGEPVAMTEQLLDGYAHVVHEAFFLADQFLAEYMRLDAELADADVGGAGGAGEGGRDAGKDGRRPRPHPGAEA